MQASDDIIALLIGPAGALVFLGLTVWALWKEHRRTDLLRDEQLKAQMDVNERFAEALPTLTKTIENAMRYVGERRSVPSKPTTAGRRRNDPP